MFLDYYCHLKQTPQCAYGARLYAQGGQGGGVGYSANLSRANKQENHDIILFMCWKSLQRAHVEQLDPRTPIRPVGLMFIFRIALPLSFFWVVRERLDMFASARFTHRSLLKSPTYLAQMFTVCFPLLIIPTGFLTVNAYSRLG